MTFREFLQKSEELIGEEDALMELWETHPDLADTFLLLDEKYGTIKKLAKASEADPEEGFRRFLQLILEQDV